MMRRNLHALQMASYSDTTRILNLPPRYKNKAIPDP